jgi:hypothetical protein
METCRNCGRTIGNLETAHLFRGQVVCQQCNAVLNPPVAQVVPPSAAPLGYAGPRQNEPPQSLGLGTGRRRARRYVDHLFIPRLLMIPLFVGLALLGYRFEAALFFGAWVVLGLANLILKANYRQRYD